jgi:uncharacterized protein (TIGR02246 family)
MPESRRDFPSLQTTVTQGKHCHTLSTFMSAKENTMNNQETPSAQHVLTRNMTTLNARDMEGYLANQQPDVEFVLPGGATLHGREEIRQYIEALWKAFPDGKLAFGAQVFAEDAAATELVYRNAYRSDDDTGRPASTHRKPCDPALGIDPAHQGRLDCLGTWVCGSA